MARQAGARLGESSRAHRGPERGKSDALDALYDACVDDEQEPSVTPEYAELRRAEPQPEPVLVLVLECSRPRAGSVRYRLNDLTAVVLGRGSNRHAERTGTELTIRVPDKWMSSRHARIEPRFGRWVLTDTESKNGSIVDGHTTKRAVLTDGSLIEIGHTLFIFFEQLPIQAESADMLELTPVEGPAGFATLMPMWSQELLRLCQIARSEIPILIAGESGTGKEVIARAIHAQSGRPGAFVAVNCGALPENLVENELFGYKEGAFSDAQTDHPGLVRAADGGTLFLDEIGDLPSNSQAALLRMLQEREVEVMPVVGAHAVEIDLRVVAATHRDLADMVAKGSFRHDLFARLAGFLVTVPPLANRLTDLGILIGALHARIFAPDHPGFDIDAARLLLRYPWPLNVRELEQTLTTAQVLAGTQLVCADHLPDSVRTGRPPGAPRPVVLSENDQKLRDQIVAALDFEPPPPGSLMKKHTILFLAANPTGTNPFALGEEARAIQVELERSTYRDCFELKTRWAAQPLDLLRELRKLKPTVVHFSGHGGLSPVGTGATGRRPRRDVSADAGPYDNESQHGLFFQGPDGRAQVVTAQALHDTFGAAGSSVKLVVLNACYSDVQAEALRAHVDCVVGMSGAIVDDAARNFAIGFYGGLGERESIDAAFLQGCAAISLEGLRDSDRPQLRVRDASKLVLGFLISHVEAHDTGTVGIQPHPHRQSSSGPSSSVPKVDIGILRERGRQLGRPRSAALLEPKVQGAPARPSALGSAARAQGAPARRAEDQPVRDRRRLSIGRTSVRRILSSPRKRRAR
jgi:pSer/pThr/pTyr-binding forkhead associated (FHA) protein